MGPNGAAPVGGATGHGYINWNAAIIPHAERA